MFNHTNSKTVRFANISLGLIAIFVMNLAVVLSEAEAQTPPNQTSNYDLIMVIDASGSIYSGASATDPGRPDGKGGFEPHSGNRLKAAQTLTRILGRVERQGVFNVSYIFFSSDLRIIGNNGNDIVSINQNALKAYPNIPLTCNQSMFSHLDGTDKSDQTRAKLVSQLNEVDDMFGLPSKGGLAGYTDTRGALQVARQLFDTPGCGHDPANKKVVLVFTDGVPQTPDYNTDSSTRSALKNVYLPQVWDTLKQVSAPNNTQSFAILLSPEVYLSQNTDLLQATQPNFNNRWQELLETENPQWDGCTRYFTVDRGDDDKVLDDAFFRIAACLSGTTVDEAISCTANVPCNFNFDSNDGGADVIITKRDPNSVITLVRPDGKTLTEEPVGWSNQNIAKDPNSPLVEIYDLRRSASDAPGLWEGKWEIRIAGLGASDFRVNLIPLPSDYRLKALTPPSWALGRPLPPGAMAQLINVQNGQLATENVATSTDLTAGLEEISSDSGTKALGNKLKLRFDTTSKGFVLDCDQDNDPNCALRGPTSLGDPGKTSYDIVFKGTYRDSKNNPQPVEIHQKIEFGRYLWPQIVSLSDKVSSITSRKQPLQIPGNEFKLKAQVYFGAAKAAPSDVQNAGDQLVLTLKDKTTDQAIGDPIVLTDDGSSGLFQAQLPQDFMVSQPTDYEAIVEIQDQQKKPFANAQDSLALRILPVAAVTVAPTTAAITTAPVTLAATTVAVADPTAVPPTTSPASTPTTPQSPDDFSWLVWLLGLVLLGLLGVGGFMLFQNSQKGKDLLKGTSLSDSGGATLYTFSKTTEKYTAQFTFNGQSSTATLEFEGKPGKASPVVRLLTNLPPTVSFTVADSAVQAQGSHALRDSPTALGIGDSKFFFNGFKKSTNSGLGAGPIFNFGATNVSSDPFQVPTQPAGRTPSTVPNNDPFARPTASTEPMSQPNSNYQSAYSDSGPDTTPRMDNNPFRQPDNRDYGNNQGSNNNNPFGK